MLAALPAEAAFQDACARLVGARPAAVVALDARSRAPRALVHPGLADRPTPPGSVFKLVTALAAIEAGRARPGQVRRCRGWLPASAEGGRPAVLRCWKPEGHGALDLEHALSASCNLHFVQLGLATGAAAIAERARRAGLPPEPGFDPRDARLAIGEAPGWTLRPTAGARLAAAIATDAPDLAGRAALGRLRAGLRLATLQGSARRALVAGLEVAGKTGTATYRDGSNRTHGWFVGYARPAGRAAPTLALAVMVDDASGFGQAAALAGEVLRAWREAGTP